MSKTFCVGDPHGDFDRLCMLMKQHNLIDDDLNWVAGDSTFVCIGDPTDRGPNGVEILRLFIELEKQAKSQGGELISLAGNHDGLILAQAYQHRGDFADPYCQDMFTYNGGNLHESLTIANDPELFDWMKNRPLMFKKNGVLFQHADTVKYYVSLGWSVEQVNERGLELASSAKGAWQIFYEMCDNRFWDQQDFWGDGEAHAKYIDNYLETFGAHKVVHGHTRFKGNQPNIYFDGKIINVDGSMSIGYRDDYDRGFIIELDDNGNLV